MTAIANGISLHGGFLPYTSTFLMFVEYARNAVRMAALMKQRQVMVYTHDSIGLGEDGPTHQPVEQIASLRVLLVSSIAGVIVHIPAGIGVLEAVFIALLAGEHTSKGSIIAALLAYRVLYYFIPLLLALICYLLLESQAKKLRAKNEAAM